MRYYLCGPIDTAGKKESNIQVFKDATVWLRQLGYNVISPLEVEMTNKNPEYEDYIRADINLLLNCNGIILLPGWPQSKGARGELTIALYLNMKVFYFNGELTNMNF